MKQEINIGKYEPVNTLVIKGAKDVEIHIMDKTGKKIKVIKFDLIHSESQLSIVI